jgi:Phage tail protein
VITKMEVFSAQVSAPELQLGGFMPSDDPVQIRDIQGLGPVKAEIQKTPFATGDGEVYQGASIGSRNIVLTLGLNPNWTDQTMSTLRQLLYAYFLPKQWCKMRFYSDYLPPVDLEGYCESFEPNIFSQDPEVQISVICPKPDFIEANAVLIDGLVNVGDTEDDDYEFTYTGTVPTGLELKIEITTDNIAYTGNIIIQLMSSGESQIFEVDPVTIDDTKYYRLSSVKQLKRVQTITIPDNEIINLLGKVDALAEWPEIRPGQNILQVIATEAGQKWTMAYFNRYGGL